MDTLAKNKTKANAKNTMETPAKRLTRKEKIASGVEKLKGNRKRRSADARKEAQKNVVSAHLHGHPSSPRKMRLVAELVRGKSVEKAMAILKMTNRLAAEPLLKLVKSAANNWEQKKEGVDLENVYIKSIQVDSAAMLKRIQPAPQGRAHRVRKRSNHVTVILDQQQAAEGQ